LGKEINERIEKYMFSIYLAKPGEGNNANKICKITREGCNYVQRKNVIKHDFLSILLRSETGVG
jgi:hypothetical protein